MKVYRNYVMTEKFNFHRKKTKVKLILNISGTKKYIKYTKTKLMDLSDRYFHVDAQCSDTFA